MLVMVLLLVMPVSLTQCIVDDKILC
jgi:hypothetical protein